MVKIDCPDCGGTGKVEHTCQSYNMDRLKALSERQSQSGSESLCICKCRICGQLWKIRLQHSPGTGCDDIWLKPGQSDRGYSFTLEEAAGFEGQG